MSGGGVAPQQRKLIEVRIAAPLQLVEQVARSTRVCSVPEVARSDPQSQHPLQDNGT